MLLLLWGGTLTAQTQATARLDTNVLTIGDQTRLELTFTCPSDYTVHWPMIADTIIKEVEVLSHSQLESVPGADQRRMMYRQSYTVTSFDSGYFAIPPILIGYRIPGDTTLHLAETEALLLQVNTVPVNMEADIKDIKGPLRAPFTFREALPYLLAALGAALVAFLVYHYIRKRRKEEPMFAAPAPRKVPAGQAALDALEELRYKKLWQMGEIKQYHTELTDIIREYLWAQFTIHAHEYTSDEIMDAVSGTAINRQARDKLHQTLVLADLVKFAKMQPLPLEHDASLNNAIDFVRETRHLDGQPGSEGTGAVAVAVAVAEGGSGEDEVKEAVPEERKEVKDVE